VKFGFMANGHPMVTEIRELYMEKPILEVQNEHIDIIYRYMLAYSDVNFQEDAKFMLNRFLILKSRLKMKCDWDELHQNKNKKLREQETASALQLYQLDDIDAFAKECKEHFQLCLRFQRCWEASQDILRNYLEGKVPDDKTSTEKVPSKKVPEKKVPDKKAPEKNVPDKTVLDKNIASKNVPDKNVPEKKNRCSK